MIVNVFFGRIRITGYFLTFEDLPVLTMVNVEFGMFMKDESRDLAVNTFISLAKFLLTRIDSENTSKRLLFS